MARTNQKMRIMNFLFFVAGALSLSVALFYFQGSLGLTPCPLCIFERICLIIASIIFLITAIHGPGNTGMRIYAVLGMIPVLTGAGLCIRHLWIQSLPPDQVPLCGPDLAYMLEAFPMQKVISMVLKGSGECAEVQWQLLGLTIPGWVLVMFIILFVFQLAQFWKGNFNRKDASIIGR